MTAPQHTPAPGTPLYVHLPFCAAKCGYCDFYSLPAEGQDLSGLVDAVLAEARDRAPENPGTVFFGGGTPSLLPNDLWRRLADGLDVICGYRTSAHEITVECNPESLDGSKAATLLDLGTTRISIGFQSLDDRTLELAGRVHSAEQSFQAFADARAAGAQRISIDMIYGWPGQSPDAWRSDLERVLALGPNHLSAYNLTYEEGTGFHNRRLRGELAPRPEEQELEMFETTRALTRDAGLPAYEISNYGSSTERCLHNVNYWMNGPYVGIGPSAVGKVGHRRAGNIRSTQSYVSRIDRGESPEAWSEEPDPPARLGETWWLGLRLADGVDPVAARRTAGLPPGDDLAIDPCVALARRLSREGLIEEVEGHWRLTDSSWALADGVAREFLVAPDSSEST